MALDQRAEDGRSLCYTTTPLADAMEILGCPELAFTISSTEPCALVAVRLCRVSPDGTSNLLAVGLLNLTHREGHERPTPLTPGEPYRVSVQLRAIGARIPSGHRLRVALSTSYWPYAWPSRRAAELTLRLADPVELRLPTVRATQESVSLSPGEPELAFYATHNPQQKGGGRQITIDFATGSSRLRWDAFGITYEIDPNDPLTARVDCTESRQAQDGSWRVTAHSVMTADEQHFYTETELTALVDGSVVLTRSFSSSHERDLV